MPALSSHALELQRREWKQTVGQSGMTPTAFAFLIPVFVAVVLAPFLCVFCIRKRQRATGVPPRRPAKKPALRRAEARERLQQVTHVSDGTAQQDDGAGEERERAQVNAPEHDGHAREPAQPVAPAQADTPSIHERECAICLAALTAPSPPEPALLSSQPTIDVDEAALRPPASAAPFEPILKLHVCAHEFHAECLVSWFVLRKTTCPICRAAYISKEDMQAYEDEDEAIGVAERAASAAEVGQVGEGERRRSNWRDFWRTRNRVRREGAGRAGEGGGVGRGRTEGEGDVEMARWRYFARSRR